MAGATVAPEWRDHERRVFYRNVLYVGAVAAWAALVYHGSLKARFFLDDYLHLHLVERIDNLLVPFARDLMMGAFYRPGVFPFWKLNFMLAGLHPAWYYAFNLAVLAGSCLLLMQAMQHLTGNKGVSAFSTLLFAVSPITAIGLLWLSNRFDLYATFFFLLSLVLFLRYLRFRRTWDISISVAAGTYAFFCKEIAVTLPAVLLLSGLFMFHYRGRDPKLTRAETPRIFLLSLPHFVIAGAFMVIRYTILGTMGGYSGEERVDFSTAYVTRLVESFGDYVWLFSSPWIFAAVVVPMLLLLVKRGFFKNNLVAWYGLAFALLTGAPLAMVFLVEKVMTYQTPRFFFLPGIGLAVFLAAVYDPRSGTARRRLATAFLIVAAVFASLNSYLVTNHIADKTIAAERRMDQIGDFLATELPDRGDRPIVFACRRGLDVALDTAIKTFHEEYLDRFYLVNCGSPTQVIATQDLYAARGKDLTFPETFTKNPNSYEDLSYGVVAASPKEVVDDLREKTGVYALSLSEDGTLAWVTPDALRDRMKTLGVSFE